ncbi:origin recognition complex subunit 6-domain-containing protein [Xylariales sp. AK1849]|nr:origin recognition complex subunit 6-domain-containing protein [Xylariales sp. AK1849]
MSRSLEPTLLSLIPTLPSAASLPPQLVELASSLLAQSRHNASTLKAEEEVARLYACAHIACERLKTTLDLPPIQARPPVPPRIYKRLYTHLDHILPATSAAKSGRLRTPSGKAREAGGVFGSGSAQRTRERATPSKAAALAQFRSKADGTPSKSAGKATAPSAGKKTPSHETLPPWVRPTISSLCTALDNHRIGRTVLAGMQTIAVPHGKRSKDAWVNGHLTSLLAAVCCIVAARVIILETSENVDAEQYSKLRRDILKALKHARKEVDQKGADDTEFWEGWASVGNKDIDETVRKITESGWQDDEWFTGIEDMVAATRAPEDADIEMGDAEYGSAGDDGDTVQMQRGDTMFQGQWVMTDRKREEYHKWKEGIVKRIEEIGRARASGTDVDVPA